ncbi:MAG: tandem-95 repeat protein [Planctomycetes bacterium]|nr:tandem-95 repeat protein [Planctomycetota bacterium]
MNKLSRRFSGNWAKMLQNSRKRQQRRRLMAEPLEDRRLLAVDINAFHNYQHPTDTNQDEAVSPLDALVVINHINGASGLAEGDGAPGNSVMKPDVNGDGFVSPLDVLNVINDLAEGEAGNVVTFSHQATNVAGDPITTVSVGQTFVFQTLVEDTRASAQGLFAAYFDLDYNESLVGVNERESQTVQLSAIPSALNAQRGNPTVSFRLSLNGNATAPIELLKEIKVTDTFFVTDANSVALNNAGAVQNALLGLPGVNPGDIEVVPLTGGTVNGGFSLNFEVKFGGQFAGTDVNKLVPSEVQLTSAASGTTTPTVTVFNTSDELLVPTLAQLQVDEPTTTQQDRDALVARSEATRWFTFAFPKFSSGHSGGHGTLSGPNAIIDELGAFTSNQTPGDGTPEVLVEVQFTALAGGSAMFIGNPADQAPDHDVLVFGLDNAVSTADIGFMPLTLSVVSDITAEADSGSVNENAGPIFINVLANDSISTGSGPTITNPIPTTSANGGTVAQSGNNGFNYTPATNFNGTDTFNYTITNGSTTASATVTVTVNPVDDAPVISGPTATSTNEDTTLALSGFSIVDSDSNNISVTLTANGALSQTSFSGTPSQVTNTLNSVTYTPLSNSTASDTISISASDSNSSDSHTVNITINPINDPPVNTFPGPASLFNTETLAFTSNEFQVSDVDASTLEVTLSVGQGTVSLGTTSGLQVSGNNSTSLTATGSISNLNTSLNSLLYDPIDTFIGTDTLTMTTSDLGATGSGGTLTDTDTVSLTVAPPQVPFAASDTYHADEGTGSFVLSPNPLSNDLMDPGATLNVSGGIVDGTNNQGGSLSFSNGNFTYTPPSNVDFFGTETFTYTIVQDPAPSSTGDTSDSGTITIEIQPINDGPVNSLGGSPISTSPTVTGSEDNVLAFSSSNALTISDIDAGTGDVTVTLTVNSGTLNVTNTGGVQGNSSGQLTIDGTVSQVNNTLGGLTYTPQDDFFGDDSLVINTNDNGNTGATALSDNDTVNITISPINDAPTLVVPGKQSFFTDFDNRFSSDPAPFSINDIDAGTEDVQVDLTIADGTLTIGSTSGVTVTPNPGGSNGIRITGSVSNINNALASGLDFRSGTPSSSNPLTAVVNDLANTGSGNQLTASATVDVEVLDFVPVDIIGRVFVDDNADGQKDSNEPAIEGVDVTLTGTDFQGNNVSITVTTNALGNYSFLNLRPNAEGQPYTITQEQPVFIQNGQGDSDQATIDLDVNGNVIVRSGALNFSEAGFVPEFADVWRLFSLSEEAPNNSGILFGMQGAQEWSMFLGSGWDMTRYGNARFTPGQDGNSGVLTVFDSQAGEDRTANVSTQSGTLSYRGTGSDRVYRIIGGSSLLGTVTNGANPEGESDDETKADATKDGATYASGVDALFASGGL